MKKIIVSFLTLVAVTLASCLDTVEEITINEDGSGTIATTSDMSEAFGLLKQMGGADAKNKVAADRPVDTSFSMANQVEADTALTQAEKDLLKNGTMKINMNMKENKMIIGMKFPFKSLAEVNQIKLLAAQKVGQGLASAGGEAMGDGGMDAMGGTPKMSTFDDYTETSFTKGLVVRTVNKEKYATAANDEFLKSMQEAEAMGMSMTSTYIINLPRPAIKAEGKSIKLSDDKKKVTVTLTVSDFLDNPANAEYRIEY